MLLPRGKIDFMCPQIPNSYCSKPELKHPSIKITYKRQKLNIISYGKGKNSGQFKLNIFNKRLTLYTALLRPIDP